MTCLFASDLHGSVERYRLLFHAIEQERPSAVLLGGDLLPGLAVSSVADGMSPIDFINDFLAASLSDLRHRLGDRYPRVALILGNDDGRFPEPTVLDVASRGLWSYVHDRSIALGGFRLYGYNYIPPTPFALKDWERYDVSRYVDPGCVSPEEGRRSVPISPHEARYATIQRDLERLAAADDMTRAVFLFHTPPYRTQLDRAGLDGRSVDHAPLDVHVGSIAVRRFLERRQPWLALHGHVHESTRLTGVWQERIGRTWIYNAAHDGPELSLVRFDLLHPERATRELISG